VFVTAELLGFTEPRIFTTPRCELTPKTSRGFEVIDFARNVLRVTLFPWQEWLLIHMLEIDSFGLLRYRKALVIVGRQNGKTMLAAVLAAFWLYVDAGRWPHQLPEQNFVIVGGAQKLDIAMKPWKNVRRWGAPDDAKIGIAHDRVPSLQRFTYPPRTTNGETELRTHGGGAYLPRTFEGARGQSAARLLLDELRQQYDYEGWSAIEKSANAMYDSLLVAFSNAGTKRSQVLKDVRATAHEGVDDPDTQWFVAEWSAEQDAPLDDPRAFQQANPSAGYLPGMTIEGLMRAAAEAKEKNVERIEVLGQWVTAEVNNYIDPADYRSKVVRPITDIHIPKGARTVWGVDVSDDRSTTWISSAVLTEDGKPFLYSRIQRAGMMWLPEYLAELAEESGHKEVVINARGCPAMEFVEPLKKLGLTVHEIDGPTFAIATGRHHDAVRDKSIVAVDQPAIELAVENGVVVRYGDNKAWSRPKSMPVDIAGLQVLKPAPVEETPPPPPPAEMVTRDDSSSSDVNLATASF
jgi:phage terminase large subunit-like protein